MYAFCRFTDDLGDESGDRAVAMRRLRRWRDETRESFDHDERTHPVLVALTDTVRRFQLDAQPFVDLIDANVQDQRVDTYEDWAALRGYCTHSAAPVGRIVLRLFDIRDPAAVALSDDVCIGLQLANFAQDVSVDRRLGRTLPAAERHPRARHRWRDPRDVRARRARCSRRASRWRRSHRRGLRVQLALYRLGGEAILDAIAATGYRTATQRPAVDRRRAGAHRHRGARRRDCVAVRRGARR